MGKIEYRKARRLLRDNGRFALTWLTKEMAEVMESVMFGHEKDWLAERADIVAYCNREGIACTPWHTRKLDQRRAAA